MFSPLKACFTGLAIAATLAIASGANAATLTQWNFNFPQVPPNDNNPATGTTNPNIGVGTIGTVGTQTVSYQTGNGSTDPNNDNSAYQITPTPSPSDWAPLADKSQGIQAATSTVGFSNIFVSYDVRQSNNSPNSAQFQYSTNGSTFVDFGAPLTVSAGNTWVSYIINLSGVAGIANNPNFAFRVVATYTPGFTVYKPSDPAASNVVGGNWRFDQVTVAGTPVPEPSAVAGFVSLGLLGGWVKRKGIRSKA